MSFQPLSPLAAIRWLTVMNGDSGDAPGFAVLEVTGADEDTGIITVRQPVDANAKKCLVNGPTPIPAGAFGIATRDGPGWVLYDEADGTPANGEEWGPAANSWKLASTGSGFSIYGGADAGVVLAYWPKCAPRLAQKSSAFRS